MSHRFALNLDIFNPELGGKEELLKQFNARDKSVFRSNASDPSLVISEVADRARLSFEEAQRDSDKPKQEYQVLVIFTEGKITEIAKTREVLSSLSDLPISVILVITDASNLD